MSCRKRGFWGVRAASIGWKSAFQHKGSLPPVKKRTTPSGGIKFGTTVYAGPPFAGDKVNNFGLKLSPLHNKF